MTEVPAEQHSDYLIAWLLKHGGHNWCDDVRRLRGEKVLKPTANGFYTAYPRVLTPERAETWAREQRQTLAGGVSL